MTGERSAPPGLRERKKTATRRALSEAALRLVAERGFDNVLVEDIAHAVDVSPRTFNNYFASKHEAIVSLVLARREELREALAARPADEPLWDAVAGALADQARTAGSSDWLPRYRLIRETPALDAERLKAYARVEDALAAEIAGRTGLDPRADLFPRLAANAAVAALRAALHHWLDTPGAGSYPELLHGAVHRLGDGLAVPGTDHPRETPDAR
ncbi:TetR family transcriptional regulator [Streptomyces sp. SBT349]|uniref:acyl-CoA-like ligand-binding transcription factor n=1 Tax=Streptomyces sp. SBT349 TaxID=1580539 RepID=UPI0007C810BE|nr:TetR family transcriptional regulator [Streptomyces sp. SBT349]